MTTLDYATVKAVHTPLRYVKHFSSWVSSWEDYVDGVQVVPREGGTNGRGSAPVSREFDESPEAARAALRASVDGHYSK
mgnify:CR=1 FL=1